jgi:hypothetical protein
MTTFCSSLLFAPPVMTTLLDNRLNLRKRQLFKHAFLPQASCLQLNKHIAKHLSCRGGGVELKLSLGGLAELLAATISLRNFVILAIAV